VPLVPARSVEEQKQVEAVCGPYIRLGRSPVVHTEFVAYPVFVEETVVAADMEEVVESAPPRVECWPPSDGEPEAVQEAHACANVPAAWPPLEEEEPVFVAVTTFVVDAVGNCEFVGTQPLEPQEPAPAEVAHVPMVREVAAGEGVGPPPTEPAQEDEVDVVDRNVQTEQPVVFCDSGTQGEPVVEDKAVQFVGVGAPETAPMLLPLFDKLRLEALYKPRDVEFERVLKMRAQDFAKNASPPIDLSNHIAELTAAIAVLRETPDDTIRHRFNGEAYWQSKQTISAYRDGTYCWPDNILCKWMGWQVTRELKSGNSGSRYENVVYVLQRLGTRLSELPRGLWVTVGTGLVLGVCYVIWPESVRTSGTPPSASTDYILTMLPQNGTPWSAVISGPPSPSVPCEPMSFAAPPSSGAAPLAAKAFFRGWIPVCSCEPARRIVGRDMPSAWHSWLREAFAKLMQMLLRCLNWSSTQLARWSQRKIVAYNIDRWPTMQPSDGIWLH